MKSDEKGDCQREGSEGFNRIRNTEKRVKLLVDNGNDTRYGVHKL